MKWKKYARKEKLIWDQEAIENWGYQESMIYLDYY